MIMIIGQKIVWGRWYFQGMPGIQQADMEENQWHLDGAFFFNNIELAAKLTSYFFYFPPLLMAFRQNWKTFSRLLSFS